MKIQRIGFSNRTNLYNQEILRNLKVAEGQCRKNRQDNRKLEDRLQKPTLAASLLSPTLFCGSPHGSCDRQARPRHYFSGYQLTGYKTAGEGTSQFRAELHGLLPCY